MERDVIYVLPFKLESKSKIEIPLTLVPILKSYWWTTTTYLGRSLSILYKESSNSRVFDKELQYSPKVPGTLSNIYKELYLS